MFYLVNFTLKTQLRVKWKQVHGSHSKDYSAGVTVFDKQFPMSRSQVENMIDEQMVVIRIYIFISKGNTGVVDHPVTLVEVKIRNH